MSLISRLLTLLLVILTFLFGQSGTITGSISDRSTGLPLIGVNVIIKNSTIGVASDLDGKYAIKMVDSGDHVLQISMIGYSTTTANCFVPANDEVEVSVQLEPIVLDYKQNIEVLGDRMQGTNLKQHLESKLTSTEDMIGQLKGMSLITRGAFAQEPIFRGLSAGQVNITIDGMKCFGACTDRMDPITSYVEVDALNSIEIGMGALSLEQGSTIGGSLNISHLQPTISQIPLSTFYIKSELQSVFWGKKLNMRYEHRSSKQAFSLNLTYRKALNYRDSVGNPVPFTSYEKINYNLGFVKRLGHGFKLNINLIGDDAFDIGYAALPMDVSYAQMRMLGISLLSAGNNKWLPKLEIKLYGNFVNHWMDDSRRTDLFMNMQMDMPGQTRTGGGFLDFVLAPAKNHMLQLRTDFYLNTNYAEMVMHPENSFPMKIVTWPDVERINVGQYLEYQWAISSNLSMKAALRFDFYRSSVKDEMGKNALLIYYPDDSYKRDDLLQSGNIFIDYRINPYWQSTIALAKGSRIPTVTELYGYFLYVVLDGYVYLGDPQIESENSFQIEWRNKIETDYADINMNIYHYSLDNYIFGIVNPTGPNIPYANGWKYYKNSGDAEIYGAELSFLSEIDWNWSIFGSATYEIGKLNDLNDNIPMIPPLEIQTAIKYQKYPYWIQLEAKWSAIQNLYSTLSGENETPAYQIYALRAEYDFQNSVVVNAGIENLFNEDYHDHLDWIDIPRSGRNFYVSCSYNR